MAEQQGGCRSEMTKLQPAGTMTVVSSKDDLNYGKERPR
jgi:hypothetical protein